MPRRINCRGIVLSAACVPHLFHCTSGFLSIFKMKFLAPYALWLNGVAAAAIVSRAEEATLADNLTIDVDYAIYQGQKNQTTGINSWKGIRYAAAPIGDLRWKAPQTPAKDRKTTIKATEYGATCPQAFPSIPNPPFIPGNEDCLFLNVQTPSNAKAKKLPVLVWIHGGGYGLGDGRKDLSEIINANDGGFVGVSIQYRLGAFGFLSSADVKKDGILNAGLRDVAFALEWIQEHIEKFGGDRKQVTIAGESAGGGAVMLLGIAEKGDLKTSLYKNGIAASPWLPAQYDYNHATPTAHYQDLAQRVGCNSTKTLLKCLRVADSQALQEANNAISTTGTYATWAFLPVTEPDFITSRPSKSLTKGKVNGQNILVGNNANEGPLFVPPIISTLDDLKNWLHLDFPTLSDADIQTILTAYPSPDHADDPNALKFATNGIDSPTAVNVSQVATGHQQRANNIHAEARFVCPSYWLNSAYANSYHYQYSVPFASHQDDIDAYFGPSQPNQSPSFSLAFRRIWGNFITRSNPSIADEEAAKDWPKWKDGEGARLLNLNTTGGVPYQAVTQFGASVTQFREPGLQNDFDVASAW
ncbi:alpha/beta-hydrolase, partial [Aaosphaeria arxii CBS 175.79]